MRHASVIHTSVTLVSLLHFSQLVDPPEGFTFGTIKDTSTEDFFRKSSSARLRKIYDNMKDHNVETFSDGMKKVRSGWVLLSYTGTCNHTRSHIKHERPCLTRLDYQPL